MLQQSRMRTSKSKDNASYTLTRLIETTAAKTDGMRRVADVEKLAAMARLTKLQGVDD